MDISNEGKAQWTTYFPILCGPGMNCLIYNLLTTMKLNVVSNALATQLRILECFWLMCTSNSKDHLLKNTSYEIDYPKLPSRTYCNPSGSSLLETKTLQHSMCSLDISGLELMAPRI